MAHIADIATHDHKLCAADYFGSFKHRTSVAMESLMGGHHPDVIFKSFYSS